MESEEPENKNSPPPPHRFSEHLNERLVHVFDPPAATTETERLQHVKELRELARTTDAYVTLSGAAASCHLPTFDWNQQFRKAYTLFLWVRPRLADTNVSATAAAANEPEGEEDKDPLPRVLYRFSSHPDDSTATGLCVTCSDWKLSPDNGDDGERFLETSLMAYSLPHMKPEKVMAGPSMYSSYVRVPQLRLQLDTWQLLCFSHVFPYLKRPSWTVSLNGSLVYTGELLYPTLVPQPTSSSRGGSVLPVMDTNYLLHHVVTPAATTTFEVVDDKEKEEKGSLDTTTQAERNILSQKEGDSKGQDTGDEDRIATLEVTNTAQEQDDAQNDAREQVDTPEEDTKDTPKTVTVTMTNWELDIAAVSLHPDAIGLRVQAVAAEAGPLMALQSGRILPTLPPVCNWSKGSSLEGPKVGIPLVVHSVSLELQRLSATQVMFFSAMAARVLGQDVEVVGLDEDSNKQNATASTRTHSCRILCTRQHVAGSTLTTPRVGLVQPGPVVRLSELENDDNSSLYISGQCHLTQALNDHALACMPRTDDEKKKSSWLKDFTPHLSIALAEQGFLSALILPFFLSLCPPTKAFDMHPALYNRSLQQLLALYSHDGRLAAELIRTLAVYIQHGGGRVHEQVLQSGTIHILASSLRLGLIRAVKFQILGERTSSNINYAATVEDLVRQNSTRVQAEEGIPSQARQEGTAPKYIPQPIVQACTELVNACCGPAAVAIDELAAAMQIRRTSDLAMTALFGFALDFDLWGATAEAAAPMATCVAERYGGDCITAGYILRSQMSVEHFLDAIRLRLDTLPASVSLQTAADSFSEMLQAMLLSSLLNRRSIAQGEHDVKACVRALSGSPLGLCVTHVILNALIGLLIWCEILPVEVSMGQKHTVEPSQERKIQVASRLGRNLLITQFHDVIAPMVLSRTAFSGESTLWSKRETNPGYKGSMRWESHWGYALHIFSWLASIAGPEGIIASKSCGSLLYASGVAGSLRGALDGAGNVFVNTLFLPPPGMALMAGSTVRDEWSYTDLLSDRLQVMMPLLPGMIVSVLSRPPDATSESEISSDSMKVLCEILTSVGGAFHRVFGGVIHSSVAAGTRNNAKQQVDGASATVKAAKTYVPHLLVVAAVLEDLIVSHPPVKRDDSAFSVLRRYTSSQGAKRRADSESWVDVSSTSAESFVNEVVVSYQPHFDSETLARVLQSCQRSAMNTAAGLISNAMALGGAGTTSSLWQSVLATLRDSVIATPGSQGETKVSNPLSYEMAAAPDDEVSKKSGSVAEGVLCRLIAFVLRKTLNRDAQSDIWNYEMSSAVSTTCALIEEKNLLAVETGSKRYGPDEVMLLCVLVDILSYGRESTGWCQLALPSMPARSSQGGGSGHDMQATSKLLLPALQPCFRIVLSSVRSIPVCATVRSPVDGVRSIEEASCSEVEGTNEEALLGLIISELDHTLTAAIVGLSFPSARDAALNAMATLRKTVNERLDNGDENGAQLCRGLICKVAEELRARYESERRLRDSSLFDAESEAVERLLGGDVLGQVQPAVARATSEESSEEIFFEHKKETDKKRNAVSDDFVLFQQSLAASDGTASGTTARLGFPEYDGLGEALEEIKIDVAESESLSDQASRVVSNLSAFLDSWDAALEQDESESELVKQFDISLGVTQSASSDGALVGGSQHITGSETAADAMSSFFEFAAEEKSRLKEVTTRFLPSHRYSRMSFTERFCWSAFMGFSPDCIDQLWERGMADGNRDMRSRIATIPCFPQFRQYIPGYLDHKSTADSGQTDTASVSLRDSRRSSATPEMGTLHDHLRSSAPAEMDEFTKALLNIGKLEIVDITKKETAEEDEPELSIEPSKLSSLIDEEESDMFPESEPSHERPLPEDSVGSEREALADDGEKESVSYGDFAGKGGHSFTTSSFSTAPDNASSSLGLMRSAAASLVEQHIDRCLHVKAEGSRPCTMLLTSSHLILEYEGSPEGYFDGEILAAEEEAERLRMIEEGGGSKEDDLNERYHKKASRRLAEVASLRPKSIRFNLFEASHIYLRRYRLRDSSIELFFIPSGGTSFGGIGISAATSSLFLDFGPGYEGQTRRDDAAFAIMRRAPPQARKQWPDRSAQFLSEQLSRLTMGWVEGRINNFDYLLHLNMLGGRTFNDPCQYPVFPWVLSNYTSEEVPDLTDRSNFRDLTKPVGALNPERLEVFTERYNTFADPSIPPFMYGSHYSTSAGVVLHFLVRLHPFAGLHRQLQGGYFDVADRLFSSVPRTWSMCTGSSAAEVKEITPEWYCNPDFLRNVNKFMFGTSQDGDLLGDVVLPPWAGGSPEKFVEIMRAALESDICSEMLPDWIDLIFGYKQQGPESVKASNVYFYLTYYGAVDIASIKDDALRQATELQIAHFGQCPMQLFKHRPHVRRLPRRLHRLPFHQLISTHHERVKSDRANAGGDVGGALSDGPVYLPFYSAPLSHWVHLDAPPPGPHSALVAVRFAGFDRTLAVDSQGIFHVFRWTWRPEEISPETPSDGSLFDRGCFVAQRELPRFRSVPRLMYAPPRGEPVTVAISKTLFAGRAVLLVLSDADGQGALGIQLVDPSKGSVKGEVALPQIHSARVTCIATDPIGTAAGHDGVGGELALVGSADGNASIWRFMSSHHLPLRPRLLLSGHNGCALSAVALCAPIQLAVTVSSTKCCLHSITNGGLIRSFGPPRGAMALYGNEVEVTTKFADNAALALSVQGLVICVCESTIKLTQGPDRTVATLNLITVEGVEVGSMPLEPWRGLPHKIQCIPDGTAAMVCSGRGVTFHRLSACQPLAIIDEWHITESDDLTSIPAAQDIDLGPSLNRPVVAAAACSNGALRLHALPGISQWSERHRKGGISQTVGDALAKPARRLKSAVQEGLGIGRHIAGMGRDIGREVSSDVKERGVGGFLNSFVFGKGNSGNSN